MIRTVLKLLFLVAALMTALPALAQSIRLQAVTVSPSDYLLEEDIKAVTARYVGRDVTFSDLQAMLSELNGLYARAGVPTARAVLPPQEIRNGVLRVSLIEAEIEKVVFEGLENTSPRFLESNLSLEPGTKPDFERLERDLMIFDIAHDISPQLSFAAGGLPGTTQAIVTADEPKRLAFTLSADNFGREETGELRTSLFARANSLTGVRDSLSLQLQKSEGAGSVSAGYSRPVGGGGGRVVGAFSYSQSSIIGGEFQNSKIVSDSYAASLSYRRPAWVRPDSYVMLEGGASYEVNSSTFDGVTFADIDLWDVFASARYNRRFASSTLGFSAGLRAGSASAKGTSQTEGSFWMIYGEGTYARPVGDRFMFNGSLRYQYAHGRNLPVARLFTAGGVGSVRGYPSDIRGGDSGAILNLQVSMREPWSPASRPNWNFTPFAFVDTAMVVPYRVDGSIDGSQDFLASVGAGVSASLGERANLIAMVGIPLRKTLGFNDEGRAVIHVGLDFNF